ncbi:DNA-binding transcriptional regulator, AcrR family [Saccharopolyspora antimicrobica]|uniref:DNA-binding transcriptional regulator, AcrR family n=1 Tax=Saccharopolyspora antimicrobica TaxID=455193 RepID=A0A1I4ZJS8_9PSEU|nr:TetR/AcrR family transcriptional regulator [Saccharopolyspora antimicrobica]RKT83505.1 TetR family transcriptional regulator [Saccharopolyspora antimicrobica]SFN50323.1 DNA-binding transcriptional regulator, AcrR family [Saccharopolyspora antimicrobica]
MTTTNTQGKRLRADAQRNRDRVLAAAQELFAAEGLAVPLDDIARRAGVGPGTVYRHFPTKEALFDAVVSERIRRMVDRAREQAEADDPGQAFFDYFRLVVEQASLNKDICDALESTGSRAEATCLAHDFDIALGVLLERAQHSGAVRPELTPAELHSLIIGCITMHRRAAAENRMPQEIELVVNALRAT